jgi:hypothetical protein
MMQTIEAIFKALIGNFSMLHANYYRNLKFYSSFFDITQVAPP